MPRSKKRAPAAAKNPPVAKKTSAVGKPRKMKALPIVIVVVLAVVGVAAYMAYGPGEEKNYYEFASCLVENHATMYGTDRCLYCQREKREIGLDAFNQEMRDTGFYVQCDQPTPIGDVASQIDLDRPLPIEPDTTKIEVCSLMEIDKTPTWVINGERYIGMMNIPMLSQLSGCPIPGDYEGDLEPKVAGHTG